MTGWTHELDPDWHANVSALLDLRLDQQGSWTASLQVLEVVVVLRFVGLLHMEISYDSADDEILFNVLSFSIKKRRLYSSELATYRYGSYEDREYCVVEIDGTAA